MNSDTVLSDFFDGNQAWFQGKQGIISLTYTFGESIKEAVASSAKRVIDGGDVYWSYQIGGCREQ